MKVLDELLRINSVIVSLTGFGIIGAILGLSKQIKARKNQELEYKKLQEKRLENLEYATRSILHDKIYTKSEDYLERGYVTIEELNNLDYLYRGYKALNGNGTGDSLYQKVLDLPTKGGR